MVGEAERDRVIDEETEGDGVTESDLSGEDDVEGEILRLLIVKVAVWEAVDRGLREGLGEFETDTLLLSSTVLLTDFETRPVFEEVLEVEIEAMAEKLVEREEIKEKDPPSGEAEKESYTPVAEIEPDSTDEGEEDSVVVEVEEGMILDGVTLLVGERTRLTEGQVEKEVKDETVGPLIRGEELDAIDKVAAA